MSFKEIYEQENYENTLSYIVEQIEDKYGTYLSEDEVALIYEVLDVIYEAPKIKLPRTKLTSDDSRILTRLNKRMDAQDKFKDTALAAAGGLSIAGLVGLPLYHLEKMNKKLDNINTK